MEVVSMSTNDIIITNQLTEDQKQQAAAVCYEAFSEKIASVWLFDDDVIRATAGLKECLNFEYGRYALQDNKVLGLIGLNIKKKAYTQFTFTRLKKYYGLWGSLWRSFRNFMIFSLFASFKHEDMHIDLIATAADARGKGVGTQLLQSAFDTAREQDIQRISLTVVDTNPRAQSLYERLGFVVTETKEYGHNTEHMGFTKERRMVKEIS